MSWEPVIECESVPVHGTCLSIAIPDVPMLDSSLNLSDKTKLSAQELSVASRTGETITDLQLHSLEIHQSTVFPDMINY
ncbi:MAG: hypothetical protein J07HQX50_00269 [Haloquadratum sp. J07HQX50]|jgi:hypothetical protein|nr:MAG: hypothetical protein J07HQX50_00269 [Haloquadratum sp. J07HQX50]